MSECILIRREEVEKILAQEPIVGKRHLEPLKTLFLSKKLPFGIMEDVAINETPSEIHKSEGDLWICLEGEAEFTYGGELVNPKTLEGNKNEVLGESIKNGATITLKAGDWLWIPAGEAHMHRAAGKARLTIIKIPYSTSS